MKLLIGSILASLVAIAVAASPAPAQNFGWPNQRFGAIPTPPRGGSVAFSPIELAAEGYHDAVAHFQDESRRVRGVDRFAARLIDRLDRSASDLCRTAKRTNNLSRLFAEANEIESLQASVETAVFASGCPIIRRELAACWNEVQVAFVGLSNEIAQLQAPVYGSHSGSRWSCGVAPLPSVHSSQRVPIIDPRRAAQVDPRFNDPRFNDPRFNDPRFNNPRFHDRRLSDPGFGNRGIAPVQRVTPVDPPVQMNRGDLGAQILSGFLSRVARGL